MTITTREKLQDLLKSGLATDNGLYLTIGEKRYKYDGFKFSKILENKIARHYIVMNAQSGAKTLRTIKDKVIFAIHNNGAKLKTKTAKNNRKYKILTIDGKDYAFSQYNISKRLESKLNQLAKNHKYEAVQEIKKVYQKYKLNDALKRYAIRNYKADITEKKSFYKSYLNDIVIRNIRIKGLNGLSYINYQMDDLKEYLRKNGSLKIMVEALIEFEELGENGDVKKDFIQKLESRRYEVFNIEDLTDAFKKIPADFGLAIETRFLKKSGLRVNKVEEIHIHYDRYNPTRGGSYIKTPEWIANKKACINIKNTDNTCFKKSIQCGVHEIYKLDNPHRDSNYNNLKDDIINWEGVKFPSGNRDIDRLEEINIDKISVNVYEETEFNGQKTITLHRRTKVRNAQYHIDLLKLSEENKTHYVYIKDYNKLISSQTNKSDKKLFHCRYCQHGFKKEANLDKHLSTGCLAVDGRSVKMPDKGQSIKFKN